MDPYFNKRDTEESEDNEEKEVPEENEVSDVPQTEQALLKNVYFTYTGRHRDPTQIWNVNYKEITFIITTQGQIPHNLISKAGGSGYTYFARKHLLTFEGRTLATKGGNLEMKMQNIFNKRVIAGKAQAKIRAKRRKHSYTPTDKEDRYLYRFGGTNMRGVEVNTYIICDYLEPDELKKAFARGLYNADKNKGPDATIDFGVPCVALYNGVSKRLKGMRKVCGVRYAREKVKDTWSYYLYHCHSQQ